ncbi:cytochrome c biogenesis protein [Bacillus aquiflavi]|uniref:Cytochrome c biogenesis protein n=1 Tax=Bacillus aquiflavi TaxID=2672567 RepID=A0A6B3W0T6_9BACI|nr:cytochrome c biogenesis protein ResB [Bacillus aquiflavi]MBA4537316.1 cytochrome c biogenesis protein [Bacillus aquiflavi]NEY81573.1 cytochrome c biogenesis protein [Bacillus aquiflavi]UAC47121.1 cytochrome c biogenesis protein ResB [Bacillus aquiflavi]
MNEVKCECGHVNPLGTVLCESCGKILTEEDNKKKLIDMRYEGSARRSQTYNKTIIDKIWNFFSSVKVGVWLIVITLIASSFGTIFPQETFIPPTVSAAEHYEQEYGFLGKLYYQLGFHNLYSSWWYLVLIASIGISLVICSLDRVIPLYRALKNQRIDRHEQFLKKQRIFGITENIKDEQSLDIVKRKLAEKRYKVSEKDGNILAEKGRFSRWGPYVNHIGLIIFLIGGMLRFVPGMYVDEVLWVREGETKVIPGTDGEYYLKSERFLLEVYDKEKDKEVFQEALDRSGMIAKNFQTDAVLYKRKGEKIAGATPELEKVKDYSIVVNEPLKFDQYAVYQVEYKLDELNKMSFNLMNKETEESFGTIKIDLYNPDKKYPLPNGYAVEILEYFPDFEFNENKEPVTKSRTPNNPAFAFKIITPDKKEGEISFVAIRQTIEPFGDNTYKMAFAGVETKNVSGLIVRKDLTLWVLGLGGAIFMIGVIQGSYWNHRRIWLQRKGNDVWIAAHTNKNWHGLKRELELILKDTSIREPEDQVKSNKNG